MVHWRRIVLLAAGVLAALVLAPSGAIRAVRADSDPSIPPGAALNQNGQAIPAALPGPPTPGNDLGYNKGPVMHNVVAYNVFWLPAGRHFEGAASAAGDTTYENLMNRFFQDVGGTDYYNIVSQYPDGSGAPGSSVTFGGSTVDTTAYPHAGTQADPLSDDDIHAAVTRAATSQGWTEDLNHIYLVYTGLNVAQCMTSTSDCTFFRHPNAYCAYHNNFTDGGRDAIYAFMGDQSEGGGCGVGPGGPNNTDPANDVTADAQVSVVSHEFIESVTDPKPNTGWAGGGGGAEIGDKCNATPSPQNQDGADVVLHGNEYVIQMEWSNATHTCAMSLCGSAMCPTAPTVQKTADATVTTGQRFNVAVDVRNPSDTDAATSVTVTDTLPNGATYVPGSASPAPTTVAGQAVTWNLGILAVHQPRHIAFQADAGAGLQNGDTLHNCASLTWSDMLGKAQSPAVTGCADTGAVNQPPVLVLPGTQTGEFHDPMSFGISATDAEAGDTLTFGASGLPAGLGLTDHHDRTATVSGVPQAVPGTYVATFTVDDGHQHGAVTSGAVTIVITREESALRYTGPTVIANGFPVTLSALLLEDDDPTAPIAGRSVVLTLGSGATAQSCGAVTLADGTASCGIPLVSQPLGPGVVGADFAGDAFYLPSSTSAQTIIFAFLDRGAFVVGDQSAAISGAVTFWGADWSSLNGLSGGDAPRAFKGFAANTSEPPANGDVWTTGPGNSSQPPDPPLPSYMGVVVADSVTKSGSTISGDTVHIVVVKVDPGYDANPGHPGAGTVVAQFT